MNGHLNTLEKDFETLYSKQKHQKNLSETTGSRNLSTQDQLTQQDDEYKRLEEGGQDQELHQMDYQDIIQKQQELLHKISYENQKLKDENQDLRQRLNEKVGQCKLLESQYQNLQKGFQQLEQANQSLVGEIQQLQLQDQKEDQDIRVDKMIEELQKQYMSELESQQNKLIEIQQEKNYLFEQVKMYENEREELGVQLENQMESVKLQLEQEYAKESEAINTELRKKEIMMEELQEQIDQVNNQINFLYKENISLKQMNKQMQQDYEIEIGKQAQELQNEVKQYKELIAELEYKVYIDKENNSNNESERQLRIQKKKNQYQATNLDRINKTLNDYCQNKENYNKSRINNQHKRKESEQQKQLVEQYTKQRNNLYINQVIQQVTKSRPKSINNLRI